MASLVSCFASLSINSLRCLVSSNPAAASIAWTTKCNLKDSFLTPQSSSSSTVVSAPPSRGFKGKTYRTVKRYTFGVGQVEERGPRKGRYPLYEKRPKSKPLRSGIPFGHKILHYEDMFVSMVGYKAEHYKGGPKPRFNDDEKKVMEKYMTQNAPYDEWDPKEAVFGQNDYIDILGDGNLSIRELNVDAPPYLRGWGFQSDKWEETQFHHVLRRLHFEEDYLLNLRPTKWWQLRRELTRHARDCNRYRKRQLQRTPLN